ncbi:MAG: Hpt domain-containing protein [Zoogloea sp.]|uniref:Hpt domain-containing protein n=1 Tax=Zoogloea sp. TaxID=49181 RepID=UPI00262AEF8C|nr:Hpt domain-containing protein [Zoogloea sp.]MDD2988450.1 Hpt domain-containing protein [Zoogloea sp.]
MEDSRPCDALFNLPALGSFTVIEQTQPAPCGAMDPPTEALVDWPGLETQFRGKTRFVTGLAEKALKNYRVSAERLQQLAAGDGECADIAFLAHSIKGTAGSLKAFEVQALAAATDQAARIADPQCRILAARLAGLLQRLITELEARVKG